MTKKKNNNKNKNKIKEVSTQENQKFSGLYPPSKTKASSQENQKKVFVSGSENQKKVFALLRWNRRNNKIPRQVKNFGRNDQRRGTKLPVFC